jgi:hypothetical protein
MFNDAIAMLLIVVGVPLCAIMTLRVLAKKKRYKRPVQDFRLKVRA